MKINPIEFEYAHELTLFLESIFQLKPSLITSFSYDKFRIVIEDYSFTKEKTSIELLPIEEVINFL